METTIHFLLPPKGFRGSGFVLGFRVYRASANSKDCEDHWVQSFLETQMTSLRTPSPEESCKLRWKYH